MVHKKKSILIVDNDKAVCSTVSKLLSSDYNTQTAFSGREALVLMKKDKNIDLVLTDMVMPEMSGFELLDKARAVNPDVAAVVVSGYYTIDSALEAADHGAYALLSKPFEIDTLFTTVENALKEKKGA